MPADSPRPSLSPQGPLQAPTWLLYTGAMLLPLASLAPQEWLARHTSSAPFVFFYFPVVLSAWFGGRGPGWFATASSLALGSSLVLRGPNPSAAGDGLLIAALFLGVSAVLTATTGRLREALVERDRLLAERDAALRAWDEFLDSAAHELRTPVAALQLQLQSLELLASRGELGAGTDGRLVERLGRAVGQVRRLQKVVNGMLQVRRCSGDLSEATGVERSPALEPAGVVRPAHEPA